MKLRFPMLALAAGLTSVCRSAGWAQGPEANIPAANPARPTITNPATLTPVGYLQFEQGYLGANDSPETESQFGFVQTIKVTVHPRILLQLQSQPFARSIVDREPTHDAGDLSLGGELMLYTPKESEDEAVKEAKDRHRHSYVAAATPTVTLSYLKRVKAGTAPDLDVGSAAQTLTVLASGHAPFVDVHYDTNFVVNEQLDSRADAAGNIVNIRRAQFGETFSVDRGLWNPNLQIAAEVYHFSQPLAHATSGGEAVGRANVVTALIALSYEVRPNLIFDAGFSRGLTSTSTRWQSFAGFTYLLPHRLWLERKARS